MPDTLVSIDEYLSSRQNEVKSTGRGDAVTKAGRATSYDAKERRARFIMSAEVEDRDKDIVVQEGIDLTEFSKLPVAFFAHGRGQELMWPVGTWKDVEKLLGGRPKRLEGTLQLMEEGEERMADRLARHLKAGTVGAASIGFIPKTVKKRDTPQPAEGYMYTGYEILESELVECSAVPIPANPAAVMRSVAQGALPSELVEEMLDSWEEMFEEFEKTGTGLVLHKDRVARLHERAKALAKERETPPLNLTVTQDTVDRLEQELKNTPPDPAKRSWIKRALDLLTNAEATEAELMQRAAEERLREAQAVVQAAAERKAREDKLAALESRLVSKGLIESGQ